MIPDTHHPVHACDGFPRVSGDDPHMCPVILDEFRFSPRERG